MKVAERRKPSARATARGPLVTAPAAADEPILPLPAPLPPGPDARIGITEEYARHVGRDAFFWAWPMLDIYNRRLSSAAVPELARAGALAGAPVNRLAMLPDFLPPPQRSVACPDRTRCTASGCSRWTFRRW